MKEKIEFKKIREFGEIIGDTLLFFKQNLKPLTKALVYLCGLFVVASIISSIIGQLQIADAASVANTYNSSFNFYNFGLSYVILFFFVLLIYTAMYVCILSYIAIYNQKEKIAPTIEEVWGYFKYYFFRVFGSILGLTLIVGAFLGCIGMILYALHPIMLVLGIIFIMLPIIIYIFPILTLFYPVMIMENGTMWYSLGRAFKLLKGNWWISAVTILVIYIIFYACSLVIQLPAIFMMFFSAFTHLERPITKTYAIVTSVSQNLSQFFLLLPIVCSALVYFNLVERKESIGLLSRIEGLGQSASAPPTENIPEEY